MKVQPNVGYMTEVSSEARGVVVGGCQDKPVVYTRPSLIRVLLNEQFPPAVLIIALEREEKERYVIVKVPSTRIRNITQIAPAIRASTGISRSWDWHIFPDYDAAHAAFSLGYAEEPEGD